VTGFSESRRATDKSFEGRGLADAGLGYIVL
jgi:hypothetical protein